MVKLRAAVIGAGKMSTENHVPALLASNEVELVGLCDKDEAKLNKASIDFSVNGFNDIDELINATNPDFSVVAVPHNAYLPIIKKLAEHNIHILKEKPFARSIEEAKKISSIIESTQIKMLVTLQRRYNPIFKAYQDIRNQIGRIYNFDARYTLNVNNLEEGWRARMEDAGGGCLIDMGYHTIDIVDWYFGLPKKVQCTLSGLNREKQKYDVEDTCNMTLLYGENGKRMGETLFGNIFLSRVYPEKNESITVVGTTGSISISRNSIVLRNAKGDIIEELEKIGNWPTAFIDQVDSFSQWIKGEAGPPEVTHRDHFRHVALIEAAYQSAKNDGKRVKVKDYSASL